MQNENKSTEPEHSPLHYEQQFSVAEGLQAAQPQAIQTLNWSSKSWTIAGIILTLLVATFFGLCTWSLNPLNSVHWALNVVASIIIVGILLIITWALRPCILLSVRWLDTAFKFERQFDLKQNKPSQVVNITAQIKNNARKHEIIIIAFGFMVSGISWLSLNFAPILGYITIGIGIVFIGFSLFLSISSWAVKCLALAERTIKCVSTIIYPLTVASIMVALAAAIPSIKDDWRFLFSSILATLFILFNIVSYLIIIITNKPRKWYLYLLLALAIIFFILWWVFWSPLR
jgi:MFS family permease